MSSNKPIYDNNETIEYVLVDQPSRKIDYVMDDSIWDKICEGFDLGLILLITTNMRSLDTRLISEHLEEYRL